MEPGMRAGLAHHADVVAGVLQLVVQHVTLEPPTVASMCQLSVGCRRAMQQAQGRLSVGLSAANLPTIAAFAAWLPKFPGLVQELHVVTGDAASNEALTAAEQLVTLALQLCAERSRGSAAAAAAKPVLRLRHFNTDFVFKAAALRSLACPRLKELELRALPKEKVTAAMCAALAQLTSLTKFVIRQQEPITPRDTLPDCFSLKQLQHLAVLEGFSLMPHAALVQLPDSLTHLTMGVKAADVDIHLSHLTLLKKLRLGAVDGTIEQPQLPPGLTSFSIYCRIGAVPGLQQLQEAFIKQASFAWPLLGRLQALRQLRSLIVGLAGCGDEQLRQAAAAIAAATQLTSLQLSNQPVSGLRQPFGRLVDFTRVQLHPHLCKLRSLQCLHLVKLQLGPDDSVHFTGLAALTQLKIISCSIDDLAVAAMLQRQTALQQLDVVSTPLASPLLWVSLACLQASLQGLRWTDNRLKLTDQTLHLLAPLTGLTSLVTDRNVGAAGVRLVSDAEREFVGSMRHLSSIEWV